MKQIRNLLFIASSAFLISFIPAKRIVPKPQPVAIVELFTSEGCSSCPAADAMLKKMVDITAGEGKNVIGLAMHVTYWDRLGWKDPYSQQLFTDRQKKYARVFSLSSYYTPQMIFNGTDEFVGSDAKAFRKALDFAWSKPASYQIAATASLQNSKLNISYSIDTKTNSEIVNFALVEISLVNHVLRGENKDRKLAHYNVVRQFETSKLSDVGTYTMSVTPNLDINNAALVIYIQDPITMKIKGATQINLQPHH